MKSRNFFRIALTAILFTTPVAFGQQSVPKGAKLLLLSGGQRNHHGYRRQAQLLQKALEDTRQLEVTICEDAAILETPALAKYDVIVATADRRDPEFRLSETQCSFQFISFATHKVLCSFV